MKIREFIHRYGAYVLEKVLNKDKMWLYLNDDLKVPKEAINVLQKVKNGYPIEYLFEEVFFYSDKFYIKEGVLIPRDDTEIVIERAINLIKQYKNPIVVDCCTGSGVIAIEIVKHTKTKVIATDISDLALEVAKKNTLLHNVDIELKKCNLFDMKADILVANPPYVENSHKKPNIYEPNLAFYGGDDGLDVIKNIILKAKELNYKAMILEIGYNQKELLSKFLKKEKFEFFNDLTENVRGVEIFFDKKG